MTTFTATYSPEDNKLRLSASSRLDAETYDRVKNAGFKWAPKQEIFIAPMWTPSRADLCIELAGEIDDEDSTMAERAEDRAERFEDYGDKRTKEAASAREHVSAISGRFEFGQPILVGHHSEQSGLDGIHMIDVHGCISQSVRLWVSRQFAQAPASEGVFVGKPFNHLSDRLDLLDGA